MFSEANLSRREFVRASAAAGAVVSLAGAAPVGAARLPLPFLVGSASAQITPPLEVGILMSSGRRAWAPFKGVRLPLYARAVVVQKADLRIAVVSLDLLGLAGEAVGGMEQFKRLVADAAGGTVRADNLVLASTHTHSGPESLALSDLWQKESFKSWVGHLVRQIGSAVKSAAASTRPCRLATCSPSAPGLAVNRRIKTTRGIRSYRKDLPAESVIGPEGPCDDSVRVAAFVDSSGRPAVLLVNATAHPVHEMCIPQISPDYPGEMIIELSRRHPGTAALFLQGCAGNINPPTVSGGAADARRHGQRLAEAVDKGLGTLRPGAGDELAIRRRTVKLSARDAKGQATTSPLGVPISALRVGNAAFVFLSGEPFLETALAIRAASPFEFTAVVGYAEDYIGYIPTDRAFDNGGYEPGPGLWSKVARGSEPVVRQEAIKLVRALRETRG